MGRKPDIDLVAGGLRVSIGLFVRRLRQIQVEGELTLSETSALARLDHGGPATSSALARLEQISPQSMGATLAGLEARALIQRRPDPDDGRRVVLELTSAGRRALWHRRNARTQTIADALSEGFTDDELEQLMTAVPLLERLAQKL